MAWATCESGHLLITGPSGSGKSFMASHFAAMGYPAFDSDAIPGLAAWHGASGGRVEAPERLDLGFLQTHRYLWDRRALSGFLACRDFSLLFGIAHNSADFTRLFDRVFLLTLPVDDVVRNLRRGSRANEFGASTEHQAMARSDTRAYYLAAPPDWIRVIPTVPERLVEDIQETIGCRIPRSAGFDTNA